ncbi:hypothetical protein LG315_06780 [Microbacterium marinum]|uniref:hypothetical protein n=1 Tax=Microbacterium marinum TaxID=421115 RepID=UPI00384AEB8E
MTVWQKLLMPGTADAMLRGGLAEFGGPVVRQADVAGLRPADLVASYGLAGEGVVFPESPEYVDVLLFEQRPLMRFETPTDIGDRPWPTYATGFLRGPARAPVWNISRTRVPSGSALKRHHADGRIEKLSTFASPANGWVGASGYYPPLHIVGPRARWKGHELQADFLPADQPGVELVWLGDDGVPEGFEQARPMTHRRLELFTQCDEIFEVVVTGSYQGIPVRVLQRAGDEDLLLLEHPTWEQVQQLQPTPIEPGYFEMRVPSAEVENVDSLAYVWTPQPQPSA